MSVQWQSMSKQTSHQQAKFPLPPGNEPPSSNFNPTNPPHIVFVGDLSFFCNEDRLYELFSSFGRVVHVEIERGKATGDSLLHGLVEMDSLIAAEQALTSLSGSKFMGRKLRLSRTNRNPSTESDRDRETWVQIHVSFVTRQLDKLVNEEALETIFASFGEIADVIVKRHKITKDPKSQNGYGFVYYVDIESATNAIYVMKRAMIEGVTYDCNLSYRSEEKFVNPQKLQTSGPKSEVPSPPMSIPPHSYSPYPAPPAHVAVAVYPQYSTATNPPPYNPPSTQSSSSSYPRNPPTAVSNTLHPLHPPHPPPPQNMYLNHRQMPDQYHAPRTFDGRTNAPYPPTSSPQLSMQQLPHHHYNVGIIGFPQSPMIPPSHAPPPPPVQMTTSPQIDFSSGYHTLSSLSFSPQQSFSPHQYSIYGTVPTLPPSPFESYSNLRPSPPSRSMLPLSSMMIDPLRAVPEIITHHRSDSRNVRRQRQGNLRRMEDYQTSISASISRSDSRDYIPNFRGEQHNYSSNSNNHHSQSNHHHGTHSSNNTTTNSSNSNNIQKTSSTDDSGKYKDERKRIQAGQGEEVD